jgi:attachment invasion locus protein
MKNLVFGTSLLIGFFSAASVSADDFSGSRIGLGISETSLSEEEYGVETADGDYGDGFKLEYGYDFNRIVGFDVSYETNEETEKREKLEGGTLKVGADIGYAFPIQDAFLKPYGKIGFVAYSQDLISDSGKSKYKDNSVFAGLGLRFQYSHFYADINLDYFVLEDDEFDSIFTQAAVTAGYKF